MYGVGTFFVTIFSRVIRPLKNDTKTIKKDKENFIREKFISKILREFRRRPFYCCCFTTAKERKLIVKGKPAEIQTVFFFLR